MTSSSTGIAIDRCYCEDKPFRYLIDTARHDQIGLRELAEREGCGTHCGWCAAYLRRALCSGQTVFHELLDKEPLNDA